MTVSATHDASAIATTASAAVPPSARISTPTSAVAGCPAATPGLTSAAGGRTRRSAVFVIAHAADVAERPDDEQDPGEDRAPQHGPERPAVHRTAPVVAEYEVLVAA